MPIPYEIGLEIIKKTKFRYGAETVEISVKSDWKWIEFYSEDLGIRSTGLINIAKKIGKGLDLETRWMDFTPGEGLGPRGQPKFELVFVAHCTTVEELEQAPGKIAKACRRLRQKVKRSEKIFEYPP